MKRIGLILALGAIASFVACGGKGSSSSSGSGNNGNGSSGPGSVKQINHIVWMLQENRSFDHYFGSLNTYRAAHGQGSSDVDGIPANYTNSSWDGTTTVAPFHAGTVCFEGLSPSWNSSRRDVNRYNPISPATQPMDGFVYSAAVYAQDSDASGGNYVDTAGLRAISYYDDSDIPYYYFMATQFATSDRWFSPILSRTPPNRIANLAASALGVVNAIPPGTSFPQQNIFGLLQNAGISWKIYETSGDTYLGYFTSFFNQYKSTNIAPISQYLTDVKNGTLPSVAFIETGVETSDAGGTSSLDEHPEANIQKGAAYVASLINALMNSKSWSDSVFILTYDEGGSTFDHVPPQPAAVPDSAPPVLAPTDDPGTYNTTGFRVPVIVVSPFAKSGYVSHTVMDYTAILAFVEERFNLGHLTARDAAQPSMDEFFDFNGVPNKKPPTNVPTQPTNGNCAIHGITP